MPGVRDSSLKPADKVLLVVNALSSPPDTGNGDPLF
jgi:hypothetical protein